MASRLPRISAGSVTMTDQNTEITLRTALEQERADNASLHHLITDIRNAAGDGNGRLMLDELVEHVDGLRRKSEDLEAMNRKGWEYGRAWKARAVELGAEPGEHWEAMARRKTKGGTA